MKPSQMAPSKDRTPEIFRSGTPAQRAAIALVATVLATGLAILVLGSAAYQWVKAVHVMAIISWMAAMLYLPRLFVYHAEAGPGSPISATFKVMEHRLLTVIMNPAMVISWVLGLWLAWQAGYLLSLWFLGKLMLVLLLSGVHGHLSASVRAFAEDRNTRTSKHWRMLNEVPAALMVGIVILVIVKPF